MVLINSRITWLEETHPTYHPAGKYWSSGHSEDVPLQRPQDVP